MLIGASSYGETDYGAIYILYGTTGEELADETVSAATITIVGANTGDFFGSTVSGISDVDHDGYEDITIAAPRSEEGRSRVWLLYGQATEFTSVGIDTIGIRFNNEVDDDQVSTVAYAGDVNNDGYDDIIAGATQHDVDGLSSAGAAYLFPGKASQYSNDTFSSAVHYYGVDTGDQTGVSLAGGDTNGDGYSDMVIGTAPSTGVGQAYIVYGGSEPISVSLSGMSDFLGEESDDELGGALATGDLNNDGYQEIILGARGRLSNTGSVYIVYSTVDTDGDGIAGTDGVLFDGSDTNDNDFDNDGITDDTDTTVDTSYEIPDDGYDNDGDGVVDEATNTVEENGTHTGYDILDTNDTTVAAATLSTVADRKNGKIKVTYSDDSSYTYTIFNPASSRKTKVQQYNGLGYFVVVQSNSKKVALVNAYTGEVYSRKTVNKKARRFVGLLLKDVRGDGKVEAIVTNRKQAQVQVVIFRVNTTTNKLKKRSGLKLEDSHVAATKTKKKQNKVLLRNSHRKVLHRLKTNINYRLSI